MFGAGRRPTRATVINWVGRDLGLTYETLGRPFVIAVCVRQHRALAIIDIAGVPHAFGYRASGAQIPLQPLAKIFASDNLTAFAYELGEDRTTYTRNFKWSDMLDHLEQNFHTAPSDDESDTDPSSGLPPVVASTPATLSDTSVSQQVQSAPVQAEAEAARLKREAMEKDLAARAIARDARMAARAAAQA